ncbi:hypothetical protein [Streptomyces cupreus]|uniref:Uncharacterized protein n=1 Tax=Streptomyces cupreus TaxID=2759956 RepID=A0A7X1MAG2_9ACTN|nr:hypothetical protein [Streptomyces cupreus]MBC2901585.1 hypothetical protein [Streptomyces cupreus]
MPHVVIPTLAGLHAAGRFPVERLVTTFPFERINEAARATARERSSSPFSFSDPPANGAGRQHDY